MNNQEIATKLASVFRKVFSDDLLELTNDMTANSLEQWDSLTHMILITSIEEDFAIKFKLRDLNRMRNVGDMIEMITSKLQ